MLEAIALLASRGGCSVMLMVCPPAMVSARRGALIWAELPDWFGWVDFITARVFTTNCQSS